MSLIEVSYDGSEVTTVGHSDHWECYIPGRANKQTNKHRHTQTGKSIIDEPIERSAQKQ